MAGSFREAAREGMRCPETNKSSYADEASAVRAIERMWRRPHSENLYGRMAHRAYLCGCGWWHLTAQRDGRVPTASAATLVAVSESKSTSLEG